jgi:anti-anti-sigma regulatory factor
MTVSHPLPPTVDPRTKGPPAPRACDMEPSLPSLVVFLRRDTGSCIASFNGALTAETRNTIDGIADLIVGETSVVLDFSQVDVVDVGGAIAAVMMIQSIQVRGSHLQVTEPTRQECRVFLLEQRAASNPP